ncbi:MAG: hypothetical protein AABZ06_14120 [Bdellovibrionota bacterium]
MAKLSSFKTTITMIATAFIALSSCALSSCYNKGSKIKLNEKAIITDDTGPRTSDYRISNITIPLTAESDDDSAPMTTVFFEAGESKEPITNHCNNADGKKEVTSKPCSCRFSWNEINQTTGMDMVIQRTVETAITNVQSNLVSCSAPEVYTKEIPDGTLIKISIVPGPGNNDSFKIPAYSLTKNTNLINGSFQDAQGHFFDNILHYSCYEKFKRGMSIQNKMISATSNTGITINYPAANKFCVQKANTGGDNNMNETPGCESMPLPENSAQAYYYNLFIRDSERGDINHGNIRYACPLVSEALGHNDDIGTKAQFWPLDSTFSLSLGPTQEFNVGVESFSKVSKTGDPVSAASKSCYPPAEQESGEDSGIEQKGDSLVQSCLGFAAKPNIDGTCPSFKDAQGDIRLTYRLRRLIALYPPVFDTDGYTLRQGQATDTIYVLDRPVKSSTADPLKPFTMRGPKPCPFAFFDHKAVMGLTDPLYPNGLPSYGSTNDANWNGKNIDGIQLPNTDLANSCSAVLPILNTDRSIYSLATVHMRNPKYKQVYIRPVRAWAPHYVEDTDFQACAPQATPLRDPPMHFARDENTGNVGWCAESYPTQNDNVPSLDWRPGTNDDYGGKVAPFTSHAVKNSASAECSYTLPSSIPTKYPSANVLSCPGESTNPNPSGINKALARHPDDYIIDRYLNPQNGKYTFICSNKTCDRTVVAAGVTWPKFPLLAKANNVEEALKLDTTYGCIITFDNNNTKAGKASPKQGCCGTNVNVWSGITSNTPSAAHLEPDAQCLTPEY